ncbi:beta-hexosaminidase subunit alpha-like isoform X1 [Glandiceps talaboti]
MARYKVIGLLILFICFIDLNAGWSIRDADIDQQSEKYESLGANSFKKPVISSSTGKPWPLPQQMQTQTKILNVSPGSFQFHYDMYACPILVSAFERYYNFLFQGNLDTKLRFYKTKESNFVGQQQELIALTVSLTEKCDELPSLEANETYVLTIDGSGAKLKTSSVWGALRGLETFSQLVYESSEGQLVVNETQITDWPRFNYRGILVDTGRHFVAKSVLLKNLDAMAYNKFNVFHWHIVDDQSFPYQSETFPDMHEKGAFKPAYRHSYTQEDIKSIIDYATQRGIRVVAEFDTPGHSQSWGLSQTNLLTPCYSGGKPDGTFGPINPILNSTYDFLTKFFTEIVEVFPDHYVHLGGDEVSFKCWQSNPDVTAFMVKMGFGTDYTKLESYYIQRLLGIMQDLKAGYIVWQEVFDNGVKVSPDTIFHAWKGNYKTELAKITKANYHAILSDGWYLNHVFDPYKDYWKTYYAQDPQDFEGTQQQKDLVIGGEACMWGEYVDGTNLIQRLWPTASVVGERLWSAASVTDPNAASHRLAEQRCRMVRRGLQAEPVTGPGYCPYEYSP